LLRRTELIEAATTLGAPCGVDKEIGTDALFALHRVAEALDRKPARVSSSRAPVYEHAKRKIWPLPSRQTDVKGDRSKVAVEARTIRLLSGIVSEGPEGIVVRGAKSHLGFDQRQ